MIPKLERFPEEGNDNPLRYPCPDNSTDRGAWWATVHVIAKTRTQLSHTHTHVTFRTDKQQGPTVPHKEQPDPVSWDKNNRKEYSVKETYMRVYVKLSHPAAQQGLAHHKSTNAPTKNKSKIIQ